METKFIREFLSLAETGSYFETAEQLFVTSSSLSRHIKALEEELGITLFDRTTRRVQLNQNGLLFLPYARQMIGAEDALLSLISEESTAKAKTVRIGSIPMMKAYRINETISRFRRENKNIIIDLHEEDSTQLKKLMEAGEIDFAFLRNRNISLDDFDAIPIAQDHLVAVVPRTHRLAGRRVISVADLKNESLLLISKNTFMHRLCTELCQQAGFQPRVVFTSQRAENLMDLVEQGTGIALLMQKPIADLLPDSLCTVDVEPRVTTSVFLACLKSNRYSAAGCDSACHRFWRFCLKESRSAEE